VAVVAVYGRFVLLCGIVCNTLDACFYCSFVVCVAMRDACLLLVDSLGLATTLQPDNSLSYFRFLLLLFAILLFLERWL
jgi:hypothetical protein